MIVSKAYNVLKACGKDKNNPVTYNPFYNGSTVISTDGKIISLIPVAWVEKEDVTGSVSQKAVKEAVALMREDKEDRFRIELKEDLQIIGKEITIKRPVQGNTFNYDEVCEKAMNGDILTQIKISPALLMRLATAIGCSNGVRLEIKRDPDAPVVVLPLDPADDAMGIIFLMK